MPVLRVIDGLYQYIKQNHSHDNIIVRCERTVKTPDGHYDIWMFLDGVVVGFVICLDEEEQSTGEIDNVDEMIQYGIDVIEGHFESQRQEDKDDRTDMETSSD